MKPICNICNIRPVQIKEKHKLTGLPIYRKICYNCHTSKRAMKKNITRLEEVRKMSVTTAVSNGFQTASQHKEHLAKKAGGYRK